MTGMTGMTDRLGMTGMTGMTGTREAVERARVSEALQQIHDVTPIKARR
jgi:hypothetical protein